jgi:hypothetical protein
VNLTLSNPTLNGNSMATDIFRHAYSLISPEEQKKKEWYEGQLKIFF